MRENQANVSTQRLQDALEAASVLKKSSKKRIFLEDGDWDGEFFRVTTQKQIAESFKIKQSNLSKHLNHTKYFKKEELGTGPSSTLGTAMEHELKLRVGKCICIQKKNHSNDIDLVSKYKYVYAVSLCDKGFGITWANVQYLAIKLARANGDDNFMASKGWLHKFKGRHPDISSRSCRKSREKESRCTKQRFNQHVWHVIQDEAVFVWHHANKCSVVPIVFTICIDTMQS